ncbi:hypothetical protein V5799_001087 [Amblyomma americanum]|uniref:Uncharacterized protein n=1 Tax=Amblyomma americanum TaxID=6943 RepID=A0AAQ4D169_AMBAM
MSNETVAFNSISGFEGVAPQFLGALHCLSDRFPDQWPVCPPPQTIVAIVVFVSVACSCIYGLLSEPQQDDHNDRAEGPMTASQAYTDAHVIYTRVPSRASLLDDVRYDRIRLPSGIPEDMGGGGFTAILRFNRLFSSER